MLKIKRSFHTPSLLNRSSTQLALSSVSSEDDELIQAIESDQRVHDDDWTLTPSPDAVDLENYWDKVERDIESDPEWFKFADE